MATYYQGSDLPDLAVTWRDSANVLIDFASTPHTFVARMARRGQNTAVLTKTTGITALPVSDPAATGPNLTVSWSSVGELNGLMPGVYEMQIKATRTADGKKRFMSGLIHVKAAIT